jgi:sacsin
MLLSSHVYSFKSVSMADLLSAPSQVNGGVALGGQENLLATNTGTEVTKDAVGFQVQLLFLQVEF